MDRRGSEKSQSKRGLRSPHRTAELSTWSHLVLWKGEWLPFLRGKTKGGGSGGREDQGLAAVMEA